MIDVARETLLTLDEAAERMRVTKAAVVKWYRIGSRGRRLETVKMGGARRTSVEALARFAEHPEPDAEINYPTDSAQAAQEFIRSLKPRKDQRDNAKVKKENVPAR